MPIISAGNEDDSAAVAAAAGQTRPDILMRAKEAQVEVIAGLRQMVNNPDYSDVVFLCNDGKKVCASRIHLAARSDVLKSMLTNGMAESNLPEIQLHEVSSSVMLSVLEFLYTGTLLDYHLLSWKMGWEVIIASRFFLLPKLEITVRDSMHAQIVSVAENLAGAATLLTDAVGSKAICEQSDDYLKELVTILCSNWSDSIYVQHLSGDAFHYLLANSRRSFEDDDILSFREYLRFRQVILWWGYQSNLGSHSEEAYMSLLVPDKERVLSICGHPEILETVEGPKEDAVRLLCDWILLLDEAAKIVAIRLLSNIDFKLIHPAVLAKVVEPLKICSGEILNAFRFYALRRPVLVKIPEYRWNHGQAYSTFEYGHVIYKTGETIGSVVSKEVIKPWNGVYEWEIILEEGCFLFAEVGLVSPTLAFLDKKLSDDDAAAFLRSNGNEIKVYKGGDWIGRNREVLQEQPFSTGSRVSFILCSSRPITRNTGPVRIPSTCSVSINGQDFGVVWSHYSTIPQTIYYPAVSFGSRRQGRIRIELVRGFDILKTTGSQ